MEIALGGRFGERSWALDGELKILAHLERCLAASDKFETSGLNPNSSAQHTRSCELGTPSWGGGPYPHSAAQSSQGSHTHGSFMSLDISHALHAWHASPHLVCQTDPYPPWHLTWVPIIFSEHPLFLLHSTYISFIKE